MLWAQDSIFVGLGCVFSISGPLLTLRRPSLLRALLLLWGNALSCKYHVVARKISRFDIRWLSKEEANS